MRETEFPSRGTDLIISGKYPFDDLEMIWVMI